MPSGRLIFGNDQVEQIWRHPFLEAAEVGQYGRYKSFHSEDGRPYEPEEWPLARTVQKTGEKVTEEQIDFLRGDGTRGRVRVEVADDGRGLFDPGQTPGSLGGGVGLSAMRERVEAWAARWRCTAGRGRARGSRPWSPSRVPTVPPAAAGGGTQGP